MSLIDLHHYFGNLFSHYSIYNYLPTISYILIMIPCPQENKELRLALEEHQNVMELIMSKYRQQVAQLVTVNAQPSQPGTQEQAKVVPCPPPHPTHIVSPY